MVSGRADSRARLGVVAAVARRGGGRFQVDKFIFSSAPGENCDPRAVMYDRRRPDCPPYLSLWVCTVGSLKS